MKESEKYDPFIQQKLETLCFPDEHESWKRMELLLNKERKRRPLFFIPIGCLGILLITAGSIYLFYSSANKNHPQVPIYTTKKDVLSKSNLNRRLRTKELANDTIVTNGHPLLKEQAVILKRYNRLSKSSIFTLSIRNNYHRDKSIRQESINHSNDAKNYQTDIIHQSNQIPHLVFAKPELFPLHIMRNDIVVIKNNTPKNKAKHELVLGLGMVQQIPVNGQSFVPYGNDGRNLSIADYLPYIYGSYKFNNKISIEGQFRYGAPNYVREVVYYQQKLDSFATQTHSYRYTVQKTYYHQIQFGINYSVTRKIDLGTGVQFNLFKNAIVKKDYILKDLVLNKETIINSYQMIARDDSFFTRKHIDLTFHINYRFKLFDLGLKGGMPLSSLLNYQDPSGKLNQEKSWYLNFYLRMPILKLPGNLKH